MRNSILLTGATGFLGKVVLEELFRCRSQFSFDRVYVIIRSKKGRSSIERFGELAIKSPCFSRLPPSWVDDVTVIPGDIGEADCGLDSPALGFCDAITHIVHCAGSVSFQAPLENLLRDNVRSTINIIEIARRCRNLQHLVFTSTAYVMPWTHDPITEHLAPLPITPSQMEDLIKSQDFSELKPANQNSHPNPYTFTKCVAEHLLSVTAKDISWTIVRPSIISVSWEYPHPGWVDSYAAFTGFVAATGSDLVRIIRADPEATIDVVPVDTVAMRLIQEAFYDGDEQHRIVHAVAGLQDGIKIEQACQLMRTGYWPQDATAQPHLIYEHHTRHSKT
ncbi:male sterility protein-domain-containing protein [Xylariales sp. PMI_506]|nr:male sterility protein-domain-containing protein [Xylariales sp. PMI_506]